MQTAGYDVNLREMSTPMDTYIMVLEAGDKEFNLEGKEEEQNEEEVKEAKSKFLTTIPTNS